jgi:hypothetical protein
MTAVVVPASAPAASIDWSKVDQAMGKKGADQPGGVHKYGLPRSDLSVTVDGVTIKPTPAAPPPALDLDTASIEKTLGFKGAANGGVYQFSIPRAESVSEGGMAVPPSLGTAIAINFQSTGGGKAAITGDFVLLGSEVNPILKTLRQHGIEVTALHSHMIDDSPHLFFMHFWANDEAQKLAQGLRAALDLANVKRGG